MKRGICIFEDLFLSKEIDEEEKELLCYLSEKYDVFLKSNKKDFKGLPKKIFVVSDIPKDVSVICWLARNQHTNTKGPLVLVGSNTGGRNEAIPELKNIYKLF